MNGNSKQGAMGSGDGNMAGNADGYRPSCELGFRDVELYHYRRRRFRRATKMVLDLLFLVEPAPHH